MIIESFLNIAIEEINPEVIDNNLLMDSNIKTYLMEKLTQKAINYPEFLNLQFTNQKDFDRFNHNLKAEIYRLFLTLCRAAKLYNPAKKNKIEKKLERAIISFLDLKGVYTVSLNQPVNMDGKYTELIDLVPSKIWTVYKENGGMFDEDEDMAEIEEMKIKAKYRKRQPAEATENRQIALNF